MKKRRIAFAAILLCSLLLVLSPVAQAAKFELGYLISGQQPSGNPPWLSAEFSQQGSNQVSLTMSAGGLSNKTQFVSDWYFNLNFAGELEYTYVAGAKAADIAYVPIGSQKQNGDLENSFNFHFGFSTADNDSNRFDAGEFVTYLISGDGLTADLFNFDNIYGYLTMADIQGAGNPLIGQKSGAQPVPEPTTMLLLSAGLIGLGFFGLKRSLK
jgi:hypothetical protein